MIKYFFNIGSILELNYVILFRIKKNSSIYYVFFIFSHFFPMR